MWGNVVQSTVERLDLLLMDCFSWRNTVLYWRELCCVTFLKSNQTTVYFIRRVLGHLLPVMGIEFLRLGECSPLHTQSSTGELKKMFQSQSVEKYKKAAAAKKLSETWQNQERIWRDDLFLATQTWCRDNFSVPNAPCPWPGMRYLWWL